MKIFSYIPIFIFLLLSCYSKKQGTTTQKEGVTIENDSVSYDIQVLDQGFEVYLRTIARPMHFYSQSYYETRNLFYVAQWNMRAANPIQYRNFDFQQAINYDASIDYGLELNYKLYNYFKFVEYRYGINFGIFSRNQ
ncbi:MAG: DUF6146 family protein [Flavicella sp.]